MKIWKYELLGHGKFSLPLPRGARVISGQVQRGRPVIWVEVDEDRAICPRLFELVCTGEDVPDGKYVATFLLDGETFVLHLYELGDW